MDDRLIVALDVPNALAGLELARQLGDAVSFYKIGLGMLTGGGLALANELKQEHGKRIFLDMKLFDIGATVEAAVRDFAKMRLDRANARMTAEKTDADKAARPDDPVTRLRERADNMAATATSLKKIADAADPLYKTLDDNQKRRLTMQIGRASCRERV